MYGISIQPLCAMYIIDHSAELFFTHPNMAVENTAVHLTAATAAFVPSQRVAPQLHQDSWSKYFLRHVCPISRRAHTTFGPSHCRLFHVVAALVYAFEVRCSESMPRLLKANGRCVLFTADQALPWGVSPSRWRAVPRAARRSPIP